MSEEKTADTIETNPAISETKAPDVETTAPAGEPAAPVTEPATGTEVVPASGDPAPSENALGFETEIVYLTLPVKYSDEQLGKLGIDLANMLTEQTNIENSKKVAMDDFKAQLSQVEDDMNAIATKIHSGGASGTVACTAYKTENKVVRVIRNDTGEDVKDVQQTRLNLRDDDESPESKVVDARVKEAEAINEAPDAPNGIPFPMQKLNCTKGTRCRVSTADGSWLELSVEGLYSTVVFMLDDGIVRRATLDPVVGEDNMVEIVYIIPDTSSNEPAGQNLPVEGSAVDTDFEVVDGPESAQVQATDVQAPGKRGSRVFIPKEQTERPEIEINVSGTWYAFPISDLAVGQVIRVFLTGRVLLEVEGKSELRVVGPLEPIATPEGWSIPVELK